MSSSPRQAEMFARAKCKSCPLKNDCGKACLLVFGALLFIALLEAAE